MAAISTCKHVVSPKWIEASAKSKVFLDEAKFMLKDSASEKQFKFSLKETLGTSARSKLLQGMKFFITPNTKPPPDQMEIIINCAGGQCVKTLPEKKSDCIIIASPEDFEVYKKCVELGLEIYSTEFIMTGVLRQKLDFNEYTLSQETAKTIGIEENTRKLRKKSKE